MTGARLRHQVGLELRLQSRQRVVAVLGLLSGFWAVLLLAFPAGTARVVAPWILVLETAVAGVTIAGTLVLSERTLGMLSAMRASPLRPSEYLAAKLAPLTGVALLSAVPIALAGRLEPGRLPVTLAAVGLVALLCMLIAVLVALHVSNVMALMMVLPLLLGPLLVPPVLHAAGIRHQVLFLAPTTGAMDVVGAMSEAGPGRVALQLAWVGAGCAVAAVATVRALRRHGGATAPPHRSSKRRRTVLAGATGGPIRTLLRIDLNAVARDPLLVVVPLAPLLLGLAVRFGYPPFRAWLLEAYGFDPHPYRGILLAALFVLVVQTFAMVGGLLVLDDLEERALTALRTSPLTTARYLAERALVTGCAAGLGALVLGLLLDPVLGPLPAAALPALVVLTAGIAALGMLGMLLVATNRVEGVGAAKVLGVLLFLPLVSRWIPGALGWLLAPLPTWWLMMVVWESWVYSAAGAIVLVAMGLVGATRVRRRLDRL